MPWTNASIVLNSRDATGGVPQNGNLYNNLKFNAENQNIIQGQIESISVAEVNFPYDIPNVQAGSNTFVLFNGPLGSPGQNAGVNVTVDPGFYTGTELAEAVTNAMIAAGATVVPPFQADDMPTCIYSTTTNQFSFVPPVNAEEWIIASSYTFPYVFVFEGEPAKISGLGKDILSIMGYVKNNASVPTLTGPAPAPPSTTGYIVSGAAPLAYTQYIDICSPQLCKFQFFRDGSTTNLARRSDVICRLYISNNVATQEEEGTRPFVINRQFNNSRVMRWTADNAVGTIDVNLYDDVGQPLTTTWAPRSYQITFNCYETPKEDPAKNVQTY